MQFDGGLTLVWKYHVDNHRDQDQETRRDRVVEKKDKKFVSPIERNPLVIHLGFRTFLPEQNRYL